MCSSDSSRSKPTCDCSRDSEVIAVVRSLLGSVKEMSVRSVAPGHVLHDHVDVDLGVGDDPEDRGGLARLVGDAHDGDAGLRQVVGDPADDGLLHVGASMRSSCPGGSRTTSGPRAARRSGARTPRSAGAGSWPRRPASSSISSYDTDGSCVARRHDPRVGREDAVDVGVDLADLGLERRGERDGGGVGAAAAERGDVLAVLADALEAGDDRDVAGGERVADPARA